jgi:drug/metabolite transporter (DMT)-like permease
MDEVKYSLSKSRQGELIIVGESLLYATFPVVTILSFVGISPFFSVAFTTALSFFFFFLLVTVQKKWGEMKKKGIWKDILLTSLIIGVVFYTLVFWGLTATTAINASIIGLMEMFFSFLFFHFFLGERSSFFHVLGAVLMATGAFIVLSPTAFHLNSGDFFLLLAMAIVPFGNYFQKKARARVSAGVLLLVRSFISTVFLFPFALFFGDLPSQTQFFISFPFLLFNGIVVFGVSKVLWIEGIHRIPVQKATAINAITPFFTMVFAYFLLNEIPSLWQILGLIPIMAGIFLLTREKKIFSF